MFFRKANQPFKRLRPFHALRVCLQAEDAAAFMLNRFDDPLRGAGGDGKALPGRFDGLVVGAANTRAPSQQAFGKRTRRCRNRMRARCV